MLNTIILMGRISKEPIIRNSKNEKLTTITNFDLAVDNIRKESDGSQSTSFFAVTCFGKVAENVGAFTKKGSKVAVVGSIQQRSYLTKDGQKRSTYDIIADSVEFLDPKPEEPSEPDLDEVPLDSCGSLDGEKYEDENGEQKELKFDPYTGKPLKPTKSK